MKRLFSAVCSAACFWAILMPVPVQAFRCRYPAEYNPFSEHVFLAAYGGLQSSFGNQESRAFDVSFSPYTQRAQFIQNDLTNYGLDLVLFGKFGIEVLHSFSGAFNLVTRDDENSVKTHLFNYENLMAGVSFELKGPHPRYDSYLGLSYGYLRSALKYPVWWCDGYSCRYWVDIREGDYMSVYVRGVLMEYLTYKVRYVRMMFDRWDESFLAIGNLGVSFGLRLF